MDNCPEIEHISKQFLCAIPLKDFKWQNKHMTLEQQRMMVDRTVDLELIKKYPIKLEYQRKFLKMFIERFELQGTELDDSVYSAYGRLVALPASLTNYNFKHYYGNKTTITLKENVNLISDGTTGLRTWQASMVLAEWAVLNQQSLKNKNLLELGSGIGLTGLVSILECRPKSYIFTDCHPSVLNTLCYNINLNLNNNTNNTQIKDENTPGILLQRTVDDTLIKVTNMPWEDVSEDTCGSLGNIDAVFAADVVYDESLFESLIKTMQLLALRCEVYHFYFCCTQRNETTLRNFLVLVGRTFEVIEMEVPQQNHFIWSTETPIRLFDITRHLTQ